MIAVTTISANLLDLQTTFKFEFITSYTSLFPEKLGPLIKMLSAHNRILLSHNNIDLLSSLLSLDWFVKRLQALPDLRRLCG